jgi:hypothetical protein
VNNIEASSHDPVFFTHHSFVDHIWEIFRGLQMKCGIDPTTDTVQPPENVTLQNVTDPSVGLTGYYNEDAHSGVPFIQPKWVGFSSTTIHPKVHCY